ncbi:MULTISPECIES: Shedu immune nuclease family protein [Actinosynnema]|uniref:Shedu immune nuclease family protein n=1 Tax=Actinosynnema TaxID=40566 RepID=UPI0020A59534|nr:Shedu immune nuclease family protein [Actinosynnema pretiosum]MCP2092167.1 protein of unknown function (DUF4263) [Actinosynnema pretiosum]
MKIRADALLENVLDETRGLCQDERSRTAVAAALSHMNSKPPNRRGGRALVELMETAVTTATSAAESTEVVNRLEDCVNYAERNLAAPDFEALYLAERNVRLDGQMGLALRTVEISADFWIAKIEEFLTESPTATAAEALDWMRVLQRELPYAERTEDRPARYRLTVGRAEMARWISEVLFERLDIAHLDESVRRIVTSPEALEALAADETGEVALRAVQLRRRHEGLSKLREVIEDADSTEPQIHEELEKHLWIFGGHYAGKAGRRRFVEGDEVDIPLLRPDGSLCVVELKQANVQVLTRYRNSPIVTRRVQKAVSQAVNYLVGLDENRKEILGDQAVDTRRANAIVLIGHSKFERPAYVKDLNSTLRLYNSHLNRVEVLTYDQLLDAAERSLAMSS